MSCRDCLVPMIRGGARLRALPLPLLLGWLIACGGDDAAAVDMAPDAGSPDGPDLFAPDELLEVAVVLPEQDWDSLASQGRQAAATFTGCVDRDFAYDYFRADVTLNGEEVADVDVRKKGFLGSLSRTRPSLKLNFGREEHDGRTFHGTKRVTLNNNKQDPSNLRQCLFYGLFHEAGMVAPRCNLAHVEVNGRDLGIYSHVEAVKKPFLARNYSSDDGNLYEAQLADFTADRVDNFEMKTNEREADRSDLDRVVKALEADDGDVVEALAEVIDLDEFFRFWALESLAGHWDGMTGNRNNHYVYHDPGDDLFHPIPWGADAAFTQGSPFGDSDRRASVLVGHSLSGRLYGVPEGRERYQAALRDLLDNVWDEDRLLDEAHRIAELTGASGVPVEEVEAFIEGRRALVEAELEDNDGAGPDAVFRDRFPQRCTPPADSEGRFEVAWSDAEMAASAYRILEDDAVSFTVPLAGGDLSFDGDAPLLGTAFREADPQDGNPSTIRIGLLGQVDGRQVVLQFTIPPELYGVGEIPFHGTESWGVVVEVIDDDPGFRLHGIVADGVLVLDQAGMTDGAPVSGHWEGKTAPLSDGLR